MRILTLAVLGVFIVTPAAHGTDATAPSPRLGINIVPATKYNSDIQRYLNYGSGILVVHVFHDSPAASAGLLADDILVYMNGQQVITESDLDSILESAEVNDSFRLIALREGIDIMLDGQLTPWSLRSR